MQLSVAKNQMMTALGIVMVAYNTLFAIRKDATGGVKKLKSEFHARCVEQNLFSFACKYLPEPVLERFTLLNSCGFV